MYTFQQTALPTIFSFFVNLYVLVNVVANFLWFNIEWSERNVHKRQAHFGKLTW